MRWLIEDYSGKRYEVQKIPQYETTCTRARYHEETCRTAVQSPLFSHCLNDNTASLGTETLLQRCLHDSCLADETPCPETPCLQTPCRDTCTRSRYLKSPLCQLVWQMAEICRQWGVFLPDSWREPFGCEDPTLIQPTCTSRVRV